MNKPEFSNKLFIATTIGNIFEIFDFFAFIFLSPIIAKLFFPDSTPNLAIIFTYLTISMSYLLRPIGGIILGSFGDRYGRKSVFTFTILIMALPSLVIGLLPTFSQIGYISTVVLIISRILQGFSSGAEMPGSITFLAEKYIHRSYYYFCAFIPFGANISIVGGAQILKYMTDSMSEEFLYSYGWRIPFIMGSLLAIIGFYIRCNISESESFTELKIKHKVNSTPIFTLIKSHKTVLIFGTMLATLISLITSVFHIFLPNLFSTYLHFNLSDTVGVSSAGALTLAFFILAFSRLANIVNPIHIVQFSVIMLATILGLIYFSIVDISTLFNLYIAVILISIAIAGVNGIYGGLLVDLFPTEVRYSGVALCFSIASTIGAGFTPLWSSWLFSLNHDYHYIILVCLVITALYLFSSYFLIKHLHKVLKSYKLNKRFSI